MKQRKIFQITGYFLILVVWILVAGYSRGLLSKPFPWPWEAVLSVFQTDQEGHTAFYHTGISILRWSSGFVIAVLFGVIIGILTGLMPGLNYVLTPLITTLQLIPGLAWVPIVLILFGLGNFSTIFMISVTAFVPVVINTRGGIVQIEPVFFRAADMMEISGVRRFIHIILPGAAPSLVSGLRIAAANGFRVLISAEMIVGSSAGLGYSIFQARWNLDYNKAFGSLLLIILIGLLIDKGIFLPLEKHLYSRRGLSDS